MVFPGCIMPDDTEAEALARAEDGSDTEDTAWTDGSRLDDGRVGCSVVWEAGGRWDGLSFHLGDNKEVFDAELYFSRDYAIRST
jgi:hypothetical protein